MVLYQSSFRSQHNRRSRRHIYDHNFHHAIPENNRTEISSMTDLMMFLINLGSRIKTGTLGAVHMSRASPANRADSILSRPMVA